MRTDANILEYLIVYHFLLYLKLSGCVNWLQLMLYLWVYLRSLHAHSYKLPVAALMGN